ncbi:MAG: hypothetical protein ACK2US_01150 [Anaerolineae bacterium]
MQSEVLAWQHIYTSVEREQSPHDRAGFQTLFYSQSGLTEAEVREMEARLVYFSSDVKAVKHLFSTTSTGKIMVAQVVHLAEPDRLGRTGRYLAHNLVLDPAAFARVGSDPFLFFRQFPFITTVAQALEQGDLQTCDIPPVSLDVAPEAAHGLDAAKTWAAEELKGLALLALRAGRLTSDRLAVAFIGEPSEVESALEAALLAVPTSLRPRCSFDTYFHHCNLVDTYYWALGLLEPPSNRRLIRVNVQSRLLEGAVPTQPETAYERWAAALIEDRRLDDVHRYRDHAFAICEWLEGRTTLGPLLDTAPSEVVDSVFQLNRELVQALLRAKLEGALPAVLAHRTFRHLSSEAGQAELFAHLRARVQLPELLDTLYRVYASQGFHTSGSEETQAIGWLLERADHAFLRLLHACWTGQRNELRRELRLLNKDDYREFVQAALRSGIVEPWALPVPGKGDAFLDLYLALGGPERSGLVALVRALLKADEASCLSRLTPYVRAQSEQELRALEKTIAKRPNVPKSFRHAVGDAVAALPPRRKGLLSQLLGH